MLKTERIDYKDGDTLLEGFCAYQDDGKKKPAILVVHDWAGKGDFTCDKATKLAELGYVGFAVDMFGKGKIATTKEEKAKFMKPLVEDRPKLQKRMLTAFDLVKSFPFVDPKRMGSMGYCFGGLCSLDLARIGADVTAVVSFHGALIPPPRATTEKEIKAKILVLHGFADPMVTPDKMNEFCDEMVHAKADWQLHIYGDGMHAFTNPKANDHELGTVYNKRADERSWQEMVSFFKDELPV